MAALQRLLEKLNTSNSNIALLQSELDHLQHTSTGKTWTKGIRSQLLEIQDDIHSLHEQQTKLESSKHSLQAEVNNLHHQIDKLSAEISSKQSPQTAPNNHLQHNGKELETVPACHNNKHDQHTPKRSVHRQNQIPDWIANNKQLQDAIKRGLPSNYNFEIYKSIWRLSQCTPKCERVGLQFPEGLLMYSCIIADILEQFANVECIILGDVTYGACCIDDYTSSALQCDFLIHYGHSCLIPINTMNDQYYQRILYVFVQIAINPLHLISTIKLNFDPLHEFRGKTMVIAGTIQFVNMLQSIKQQLCDQHGYKEEQIIIPQAKPLSPAEVLGCTSPDLNKQYGDEIDCIVFISDGRFHLESIMIANPQIADKDGFFRYNPYDNKITKEAYNTRLMHKIRYGAIEIAKTKYDKQWCVILSTLGRQGNVSILQRLLAMLKKKHIEYVTVLLSEIYGEKLRKFDLTEIQCFVQIGCPRLSIDWGADVVSNDNIPLLNAYEATVALQQMEWKQVYPMDYYRSDGGVWSNYYMTEQEKMQKDLERKERRKQLRKQRLANKNKKANHVVVQYQ